VDETTSERNRWALVLATVVVIVVAAVGVVIATRGDGDGVAADVPEETLSGPGTELADGLEVAPGSSLLGPVVVTGVDGADEVTSWSALVVVEDDDPIAVWQAYTDQLADRFPEAGLEPADSPGCRPAGEDADVVGVCSLEADDGRRDVDMTLRSVPGDVTGRYLLVLEGDPYDPDVDADHEVATGADSLPDPQPARERPGVGEPLALTTAYDDDGQEYVVAEGSELLAQYGAGSYTGGFAVLLRVAPDADLDAVVEAYVRQANQRDDTEVTEETPPPDVTEHDGTTVSEYDPPGGAGGYTGSVTVVDQPDGDDYILFELTND
jgi:hypothetical protein